MVAVKLLTRCKTNRKDTSIESRNVHWQLLALSSSLLVVLSVCSSACKFIKFFLFRCTRYIAKYCTNEVCFSNMSFRFFFSSLGILCLFSSSSVVVLQSLLIICCVFVFFVSYMPFCFSYSIFFSVLAAAFFLFNCNHNRGSHCSRLLCDPCLYILCFVFTLFVFVKLFDLIWQKSNKACTKSLFILDEFKEFLHQSIREALNSGSAVIRSLH